MFYSKEIQPQHWPHLSTVIYKTDHIVGAFFSARKKTRFCFKSPKTHIQSKLTRLVIVLLFHPEMLFFVKQQIVLFIIFLRKEALRRSMSFKNYKTCKIWHNNMNLLTFINDVVY